MGEVTITAPKVPPRTMMAAVTWRMSETLPLSSTNPPMMPPDGDHQAPDTGEVRANRSYLRARGFLICHETRLLPRPDRITLC